MMIGLTTVHPETKNEMVDATYLKAHRTATSMGLKKGGGHLIGWTERGMNTKLRAIWDSRGRPLDLFVTARRVGDYIGGRALFVSLPEVDWL